MTIVKPLILFLIFKLLRTFKVSITSSDSSKFRIFVFPIQMDAIINDLIEIDLSGGIWMIPFNGLLFDDLRVKDFFIPINDI